MAGRTHIDLAQSRSRALRGATLAMIVERGGHGYGLAHRLNRRLGPTWQVDPKQLYRILDEFAGAGLATCSQEPNPDRPRQPRVVYRATERAPDTLQQWLCSPIEREPVRPEVLARIVAAQPGDAHEVLEALEEYERDLLRLIEANDECGPSVLSWSALVWSVVRGYTDVQLQGELRWLVEARRRIGEFVDCHGG